MFAEFHLLRPAWLWALLPLGLLWYLLRRSRADAGAWNKACDAHLLNQVQFETSSFLS